MIRPALALVLGLVACEQEPSRLDAVLARPPGAAPAASPEASAAAVAADGISGTVVETMSAGGYTYARLDSKIWVAGPETPLTVGTKLDRMEGNPMPNFHSNTLNRTFPQIYFINSFVLHAAAAAPAPATVTGGVSGTVLETVSSGGYTYARLDHAGTQVWVAGPETPLTVGTKLDRMEGTSMPNFHSNTLDRTFPEIYFISRFVQHAAPPTRTEKVAVAAGGKTVADIFAGKDALAGKSIVVRGKVVKLNTGIMGRNWIHLRDGTGAAGSDDLLVTSQDTVTLGDTVTVTGTVATHQDFGAGYKYDVIVENATFATK
jgi:hypothetical protein